MPEEKKKPYKGSTYFPREKVNRIGAFARLRGLRGFSPLVRSMFEEPVKFFTSLFTTDPHSVTLEIFGDLKEEDGEVRIDFSNWRDEELADLIEVLEPILSEARDEAKRRLDQAVEEASREVERHGL